jgi:peptidylprolyl isomerase
VPVRSRFLAFVAWSALLIGAMTGCSTPSSSVGPTGGSATADLAEVMVDGRLDGPPTVKVPIPISVTKTEKSVLATGTGPKAALGQRVTIDYVGYNGTDGKQFDSSYGVRPTSFVLNSANNLEGLVDGLVGVPAGSRLLLAIPPGEGYGLKGSPAAGVGPTDTIVLVVDLRAVKEVLARATGTPVKPRPGLPTVTLNAKGVPKISVPRGPAPTTLAVQPLIVGKGPKVTRDQQITVQYTGVLWPGGKQFDTSWNRPTPASFQIGVGTVIAGWDRGLVGQTIGSQVLLVIPPDDGYGAEGKPDAGIKGTDTLVFVVDILDAA